MAKSYREEHLSTPRRTLPSIRIRTLSEPSNKVTFSNNYKSSHEEFNSEDLTTTKQQQNKNMFNLAIHNKYYT